MCELASSFCSFSFSTCPDSYPCLCPLAGAVAMAQMCPPHLKRNPCRNAVRVGPTALAMKGFLSLPVCFFFFFPGL